MNVLTYSPKYLIFTLFLGVIRTLLLSLLCKYNHHHQNVNNKPCSTGRLMIWTKAPAKSWTRRRSPRSPRDLSVWQKPPQGEEPAIGFLSESEDVQRYVGCSVSWWPKGPVNPQMVSFSHCLSFLWSILKLCIYPERECGFSRNPGSCWNCWEISRRLWGQIRSAPLSQVLCIQRRAPKRRQL